jgi:hypothetical protein
LLQILIKGDRAGWRLCRGNEFSVAKKSGGKFDVFKRMKRIA